MQIYPWRMIGQQLIPNVETQLSLSRYLLQWIIFQQNFSVHTNTSLQEARQAWKAAVDGFSPADDLLMMADAIAYYRHPDLSIEPVGNSSQEPSRPPSLPSNKAQSPVQPGNAQQVSCIRHSDKLPEWQTSGSPIKP